MTLFEAAKQWYAMGFYRSQRDRAIEREARKLLRMTDDPCFGRQAGSPCLGLQSYVRALRDVLELK